MREGERLLSWGVIDAFTLRNAISRQILIRIGEVSNWQEGCYIFVPGQVKEMSNRLPLVDVLRASADGIFGENFLAAQASSLLDVVPKRLYTSAFLPLVNRIPELGLLLSRITGAIQFRGLLDFNNAKRSWMRVLLLQHLGCIDFPFANKQTPVKRLSIVPDLQISVRETAERETAEADVILLSCHEDFKPEAEAEYAAGKCALGERRFETAETHFLKALALAPEREDLLCRLAWSRILQAPGNPDLTEANLPLLEQAVRAAPQNADVHFFYGFALHLLGRDAVALCELEKALSIHPSMIEAASLIDQLKTPPPKLKYK
jgi:tetratricopeptide (TPR) repeat protein